MAKLLQIDSSSKGSISVTRPLTKYFAEHWQAKNRGGEVIYRDLLESNLAFLDQAMVQANFTPPDKQTEEQKQLLKSSDALIEELLAADTYVFGVPMYNFSVPAAFKAYIDLVVRAGKTFRYENGMPKGILENKKLIVISASGGDYSQPPMQAMNFLQPYMRTLFGFLGVTDFHYFTAPGRDPETIAASSKVVQEEIQKLLGAVPVS